MITTDSGARQSSRLAQPRAEVKCTFPWGKFIFAYSLQSGQKLVTFPGNAPSRGQPSLPPAATAAIPTQALRLQALASSLRRAGNGAKVTPSHAGTPPRAASGTPRRIRAGTYMPAVMRSPLLHRAVMLQLTSNHPGREHRSLQAPSPQRGNCMRGETGLGWAEAELAHEGLWGPQGRAETGGSTQLHIP